MLIPVPSFPVSFPNSFWWPEPNLIYKNQLVGFSRGIIPSNSCMKPALQSTELLEDNPEAKLNQMNQFKSHTLFSHSLR